MNLIHTILYQTSDEKKTTLAQEFNKIAFDANRDNCFNQVITYCRETHAKTGKTGATVYPWVSPLLRRDDIREVVVETLEKEGFKVNEFSFCYCCSPRGSECEESQFRYLTIRWTQ